MRAYRPGLMGGEEFEDTFDQDREDKLVVYAERAQAGLPLFDAIVEPLKSSARNVLSLPEGSVTF